VRILLLQNKTIYKYIAGYKIFLKYIVKNFETHCGLYNLQFIFVNVFQNFYTIGCNWRIFWSFHYV